MSARPDPSNRGNDPSSRTNDPSSRTSVLSTARTAAGPAIRDLALAAVIAVGLYAVSAYLIRLRVPYVLFLVVVLAVVVGRHLTRAVAPPPVLERPVREDTELRAFGLPDRPYADVRRWDERLSLVQGDPAYFDRSVRPAIAAAVDERLRLSHGITRAGNPARAKEILGQTLWEFLAYAGDHDGSDHTSGHGSNHGSNHSSDHTSDGKQPTRPRRSPSPAELALIVKEMEDLWERRH